MLRDDFLKLLLILNSAITNEYIFIIFIRVKMIEVYLYKPSLKSYLRDNEIIFFDN